MATASRLFQRLREPHTKCFLEFALALQKGDLLENGQECSCCTQFGIRKLWEVFQLIPGFIFEMKTFGAEYGLQ